MQFSHASWCVACSGSFGLDAGRAQQQQQQGTSSSGPTESTSTSRVGGSRTQRLGAKRLGSVWRHAAGEHLEQFRKTLTDDLDKEESVIGTAPRRQLDTLKESILVNHILMDPLMKGREGRHNGEHDSQGHGEWDMMSYSLVYIY